jgi:hypothetical protein
MGLREGTRDYPWTGHFQEHFILTYYIRLSDPQFSFKEPRPTLKLTKDEAISGLYPGKDMPRKTLEFLVYLQLAMLYRKNPKVLHCNNGMRFNRSYMCNASMRYHATSIVNELRDLLII